MRSRFGFGVVVGVILALLVGGLALSPVGAHVASGIKHNWNRHYKELAKRLFFTKKESNDRFALYSNTVLVSPLATPAKSGNALRRAVHGISVGEGEDPVLVLVEPGTYNLGSTPIVMPDDVSLLGSGRDLTVIRCACGSLGNTTTDAGATLVTGFAAEVRSLTVVNEDTLPHIHGINVGGGSEALTRISDVAVQAAGGPSSTKVVGIWDPVTPLELRDVEVRSVGDASAYYGIEIGRPAASGMLTATLTDVSATAVTNQAWTFGIALHGVTATLRDTHARASEASINYGLWAHNSDLRAFNLHAESVGGGDRYYGAYLRNTDAEIHGSILEAEGQEAFGLRVDTSSASVGERLVLISGTSILANGSITARGLTTGGGSTATAGIAIEGSHILSESTGALPDGVHAANGFVIALGSTFLSPPDVSTQGSGVVKCVGAWDESYDPLDAACQPPP